MVYIDTSALVPMFIREPRSEALIGWIESSGERFALSEWTLVEFASASSIKVRTGQTTAAIARQARARAVSFARSHCVVAIPRHEDYDRAAELAADASLGLRAGDAMHIAIAEQLDSAMLCFDEAMIGVARKLAIPAVTF